MRRYLTACLSLILLLVVVLPAQAQLGGLKKKVADKVTGKKPDTTVTAVGTTGKPKCDKSSMVITSDVVDRYLKALKARDAEIQKIAKEPGPVGQYYTASFKRQAVERRKREFELRRGPDWERYKGIYLRMMKGDQAAIRDQRALSDSLDPNRVEVPNLEWEAQQKGNARLDSVMMVASGIGPCDWGGNGIGDRMPALVYILSEDPNTKDLRGAGTPVEAAAIKPRLKDLQDGLGMGGRGRGSEMTEAEKAHVKAEDEKLAEQSILTGDAYTDCATKVQRDYSKKHQAELDKASKDRDMAASQRLTMLILQETDKECKKFSKDSSDDD